MSMHVGMGEVLGAYLIVAVLVAALIVYLQWRIFAKAGHSGALALISLSLFVPFLNFIGALAVLGLWIWFAFTEWPVEKKARAVGGS
jgi:energy-converting hydrogenase Eha subunit B